MSISKIEINNFKSIKHCVLDFKDINLFIGENGTGKSNILNAIRYFFSCLTKEQDDSGIYNNKNHFYNEFSISITFNFERLKMISKHNRHREDAEVNFSDYYKWIGQRKNEEVLTLKKIKGKTIRWNHKWQYRQNIANLFPLYFIDSRSVNLTDWSKLWEIIGDLMKTHAETEQEINKTIETIKEDEKYKISNRFKRLSDAFDKANVRVKSFTPKQYATTISTLLFRGNVFSIEENSLELLSNGTNASNYTNLLIEILKLIAEHKLKDPIVMLDEPEISLHHKLIDALADRIFNYTGYIQFIAASHSPRLLKNIIRKDKSESQVFHVSAHQDYTYATAINLFSNESDNRYRTVITDQHACAYFSRYILSVEGATETELFTNDYLRELFPILKQVDIMEGISDDVVQRIISPKQRHFRTNILLLMDMDKVLEYSESNNQFKTIGKLFSSARKLDESYYYTPLRKEYLLRRKRILAMTDKCKFHYRYPFFSSRDANFSALISLIKQYALQYDTFIVATTIEGSLITYENLDVFWNFYEHHIAESDVFKDIDEEYKLLPHQERLNFARLLFNGKSDFILSLSQIKKFNSKIDKDIASLLTQHSISKTSGWVSKWLSFFLLNEASIPYTDKTALQQFSVILKDAEQRKKLRSSFEHSFPELYEIVNHIENTFKGI